MPDNRGEIVKAIPSVAEPAIKRVAIVRRPDGYYALRPERLTRARFHPELVIASKWIPMEWSSGIYETEVLAEKDAYALYPWIREQEPNLYG